MVNRITVLLSAGSESLLFWRLTGEERLSAPFRFQVDLLSQDFTLDRQKLLGQDMTVVIPAQLGSERYLSGKVTAVSVRSEELDGTRYAVWQVILEPDFWPMMRDRNFRIFQQ